jgi:hypothetical protein
MVVNSSVAPAAATGAGPPGTSPLNQPNKVQYEVNALSCGLPVLCRRLGLKSGLGAKCRLVHRERVERRPKVRAPLVQRDKAFQVVTCHEVVMPESGTPAGNWLLIAITHLNDKFQAPSSANWSSSRDPLLPSESRDSTPQSRYSVRRH